MKIIRPNTITDAVLVSSNVTENDYSEFSMGTTYAAGDYAINATGVEVLTLDVAPATAWVAGDKIVGQTSGTFAYVVAQLTSLTYQIRERSGSFTLGEIIGIETITLDVAPATDWAIGDIITGQTSSKTATVIRKLSALIYQITPPSGVFTLGEIIGVTGVPAKLADQGAANPTVQTVKLADQGASYPTITAAIDKVHKIYQSLSAGNLANYPPTDVLATSPKWVEISSTNRWKAFDSKVGSQTEKATTITYSLLPGLIDSIALMNLQASSCEIKMTDPTDGVVYDEIISLISTVAVIDWYTYFVEPVSLLTTDVVKLDLPLYSAATLDLTFSFAGTVKVGMIQFGLQKEIGKTRWSPSLGITSYSTKSVDIYGVATIVKRANAKKMNIATRLDNSLIDEIHRLLSLYYSTVLVWIGNETYSSMIICGFYKDFSIVIPYPDCSDCSIEIEGLI